MPHEIIVLALSVLLLFVHTALQGLLATKELGTAWNAGPRDGDVKPKGALAGRADRALNNYKETYPAFIGLALALVVTGQAGGLGAFGAWLWFAGRIAYIPLYLAGIPYIRSLVWIASAIGLTLMLVALTW
ncbi:MAPEG family protein [Terrihabitans sp. B22-R8]|uniref:MAPEG family protein n=1 Tax=Terrihabitans sp. B22-R8 TaxID=3425128 RepID=UPI00403CE05F